MKTNTKALTGLAALLTAGLLLVGCGEQAQQSAGEAADKAGDAVMQSAAEVKKDVTAAGEAIKETTGEMVEATGDAIATGAEKVEAGAEAAADATKEAVHDTAVKVEQATDGQ